MPAGRTRVLRKFFELMKECEQSNSSGGEMLFTDPCGLSLKRCAAAHKAIATLANEC